MTYNRQTLTEIKVIELAQFISGPYCGMLLGALGATVIKIEEPHVGDQARHYGPFINDLPDPERSGLFLYLNRSKLGITLNIKTTTGRDILLKLLEEADVLIEDMPPKLASNLMLDYAHLKEVNPRLIVASITPFGQTGPYRDYKAYAINSSALGGMSLTIGEANREPLSPPLSMGHSQTGVVAAIGIMFALFGRKLIGIGQQIDISEAEPWAVSHTGNVVSSYVYDGRKRIRAGYRTPAPYPNTILPCKDGYIMMTALQGSQWKRFLEIVGDGKIPEWYASDPRFSDRAKAGREYADALDELLMPWLMAHTREEIFNLCREHHVPFAPVRNMNEVVDDQHLNQRNYFSDIEDATGKRFKCPGPPFRFSRSMWDLKQNAPHLGEHNEKVYCEWLGFNKEQLVQLRRSGII